MLTSTATNPQWQHCLSTVYYPAINVHIHGLDQSHLPLIHSQLQHQPYPLYCTNKIWVATRKNIFPSFRDSNQLAQLHILNWIFMFFTLIFDANFLFLNLENWVRNESCIEKLAFKNHLRNKPHCILRELILLKMRFIPLKITLDLLTQKIVPLHMPSMLVTHKPNLVEFRGKKKLTPNPPMSCIVITGINVSLWYRSVVLVWKCI